MGLDDRSGTDAPTNKWEKFSLRTRGVGDAPADQQPRSLRIYDGVPASLVILWYFQRILSSSFIVVLYGDKSDCMGEKG